MKSNLFEFFRTLHAWGGVTLALLLILTGLTGSLLVWKPVYLGATAPEPAGGFTPGPETLAPIAEAVEARFENNEILMIRFATEALPLTRVTLSDSRYAYLDTDGNIVDLWTGNERWEEWLYDLHHRLLLENTGLTLVGLGAIALIILILFGVITFVPVRRGLRSGLWPKSLARRHLVVSHRNLGIVLALPLLVVLVTGVVLTFPQRAERLLLEPVRNNEEYGRDFAENLDDVSGGNSGDWLPAMERALDTFPGARIRSAQVPNDFSYYRIIGLQQPGEWHPHGLSKVYIDAEEGYMDIRIDATALPVIEQAYNSAYPLHTGKADSLFYRILLSLGGLLAAAMSFMGMTSFIKARAGKG